MSVGGIPKFPPDPETYVAIRKWGRTYKSQNYSRPPLVTQLFATLIWRHNTIRWKRSPSQNHSAFSRANSTVIYGRSSAFQRFFNKLAFRFEARLFLTRVQSKTFQFSFEARLFFRNLYLKQEFWLFWFRSKPLLAFWNSCNTFCETNFVEPKLSIERIWIQSKTLCLNILD